MECIYSKKKEPDVSFKKREHVFPCTIGGIATLPKGYVSDSVNELFGRELEAPFSRKFPLIKIIKMLISPIGRKKHNNFDRLSVIKLTNIDKYELGYIEEGIPKVIDQIVVDIENNIENMEIESILSDNDENVLEKNRQEKLISFIKEFDKSYKYQIRAYKDLPENKLIIGRYNKSLIIGYNSKVSKERIWTKFCDTIDYLNKGKIMVLSEGERVKSKVEYKANSRFSIVDINRMYLKIAFNCLAYLYGDKFVLSPQFDTYRNAVLTGQNIEQFIGHDTKVDYNLMIEAVKSRYDFGEYSNVFLVLPIQNGVVSCVLSILDTSIKVISFNSADNPVSSINTYGFICDPIKAKEKTIN